VEKWVIAVCDVFGARHVSEMTGVNCVQALSVGIFPYVLKLLQSSARELRPLLVFIWAKLLAVDSVRNDLTVSIRQLSFALRFINWFC